MSGSKIAKVGDQVLITAKRSAGEQGKVIEVTSTGFALVELDGWYGVQRKFSADEYIVANPSVPLFWSTTLRRWVSVPASE